MCGLRLYPDHFYNLKGNLAIVLRYYRVKTSPLLCQYSRAHIQKLTRNLMFAPARQLSTRWMSNSSCSSSSLSGVALMNREGDNDSSAGFPRQEVE